MSDETTDKKDYEGELPYTITLKYPVQVGKETTLTELTFTEIPDAQAVSTVPAGEGQKIGDLYPVIAAMTKTPESHIRKVKYPDIKKCFPVVSYFLAE